MRALALSVKTSAVMLVVVVVFWFGYAWLADYGDGVASGTYKALLNGHEVTLVLKSDHTFRQREVGANGPVEGWGTWRRIGEGGLIFSGSMLQLPHQRFMPNGEAYATLYKTAGVWPPFISVDSTSTAPIYRKSFVAGFRSALGDKSR